MVPRMRAILAIVTCLLLAASPVAAEEPAAEQEGPLSPCVQGADKAPKASDAWVVEIATALSEDQALSRFNQMQNDHSDILSDYEPVVIEQCDLSLGTAASYSARIVMDDEKAAKDLCDKLQKNGGACLVQKD